VPLTEQYLGILDSPIPFACGILKTGRPLRIPDHLCIVDLDFHVVSDPDHSPMLANAADLVRELKVLLKSHEPDIHIPKAHSEAVPFTKQKRSSLSSHHCYEMCKHKYVFGERIVDSIVQLIHCHIEARLQLIARPCFVTDTTDLTCPVTVFNQGVFLESVDDKSRRFYTLFSTTMMFQEFTDGLSEEILKDYQCVSCAGRNSQICSP
jgi:hypothetical protein